MKIRVFAALMLVTGLLAGSLYGAPWLGTQVTQFLTRNDAVAGYSDDGTTSFFASSYDDMNGVAQGELQVLHFDNITGFSAIYCFGPAYANRVSVDQGNGNSSVKATLDPAAPGCSASPNVSAPVTIAVTGRPNGKSQTSTNGKTISTSNDGTSVTSFTINYTNDTFTESFTGTVGSSSGPFSNNGYATNSRNNNRSKGN
jgi:hypothetical protein